MEFATRDSIIEVLDLLYAKSGMKPTEETKMLNLKVWCIALEDIDDKTICEGFKKASRIKGYMMDSGAFRDLCLSQDNIDQEATAAFNLVWTMNRTTISPYFKDACIAETIRDFGGLSVINKWETNDRSWKEKEFAASYIINRKREYKEIDPFIENGNMPLKLIGAFAPGSKERVELEFKKKDEKLLLDYAQEELEKKSTNGQKEFSSEALKEEAKLSKANIRLMITKRKIREKLQNDIKEEKVKKNVEFWDSL